MPAPSSRRSALAVLVYVAAAAACGKGTSEPKLPEADPAEVTKLAATMAKNVPTPAAVRDCTQQDLDGGPSMTFRTLMQLGEQKLSDQPQEAAWINPAELDAPAARVLVDPKPDAPKKAARQAAAELLAAKFWVTYKVDLVNAPMALGVKELKIGTIHTRIVRYEKTGVPSCVLIFNFQNDRAVSDQAIEISDKAAIDPAVAKLLREDLVAQYIKLVPRGEPPAPPATRR
jgi:hypothetical protein